MGQERRGKPGSYEDEKMDVEDHTGLSELPVKSVSWPCATQTSPLNYVYLSYNELSKHANKKQAHRHRQQNGGYQSGKWVGVG